MQINNPPLYINYWRDYSGALMASVTIDIGSWDMDTNATKQVNYPFGINPAKVVSAYVLIQEDALNFTYPLTLMGDAADPALYAGNIWYFTTNWCTLYRRTGGAFDNAAFNDAVMNRGWVNIIYRV